MGKRDKSSSSSSQELLQTLGDFTSKENWDKFFTIRGTDDSFEWYAEWPELRDTLISHLNYHQHPQSSDFQILVPGCGNSRLSEHLYDAGFRGITNIDFSKVVISDMLRRNVRQRPDMKWRVMDMTAMQLVDETFDAILDKGGLDALMEPELGSKLGNKYLSEVKRVLKVGGKFISLTLAESHVLGLLFSKFRIGFNMSVHAIPRKPSNKPSLQTFMVVTEKDNSAALHHITSSFKQSSLDCNASQVSGLYEAIERENQIRTAYSSGSDILYSLEDLQLGGKGDLRMLTPGRRFQLTLGGKEDSRFSYRVIVLDAQEQSGSFSFHCGVFIVPKTRAHEWLFSSEEGQWMVVESSKAARLIMVSLDASHNSATMDDIQKDLSPLVQHLAPGNDDPDAQIPFMMAGDGIKQRNAVHQVTSSVSGPIMVEDVVYDNVDSDISRIFPLRDLIFRRLIFQRSEGLVQSETLLTREGFFPTNAGEVDQRKRSSSGKSKKRGSQRRNDGASKEMKAFHGHLASSYHMGIVSGFMLISSYLESMESSGKPVKAVVIGLGAGVLPMFLHGCMPYLHIEVAELDPVVRDVAKDFFGFIEDKRMQVCICDGIQFVRERTSSAVAGVSVGNENENQEAYSSISHHASDGSLDVPSESLGTIKIDILIIDVDSSDSSSGMTCPAADFVEVPFLRTVKDSLSENGLFIINLVSRSPAIKDMVVLRLKEVFNHLFCLKLEEDVNMVLFALGSESGIKEDGLNEASLQFEKLLKLEHPEICQSIMDSTRKIIYVS